MLKSLGSFPLIKTLTSAECMPWDKRFLAIILFLAWTDNFSPSDLFSVNVVSHAEKKRIQYCKQKYLKLFLTKRTSLHTGTILPLLIPFSTSLLKQGKRKLVFVWFESLIDDLP